LTGGSAEMVRLSRYRAGDNSQTQACDCRGKDSRSCMAVWFLTGHRTTPSPFTPDSGERYGRRARS
jgi:hypothetical protein